MSIFKKANEARVAFLLCVLFFGFGLVHALKNFRHPYAVPVAFSDHFSHVSSVIHFLDRGLNVYRLTPNESLVHTRDPRDRFFANMSGLIFSDLYVNPLSVDGPPLFNNWQNQICPYPPGMHVLFAPFALAFQLKWLGFANMNRLIILFLLGFTAGLQFLLLREAIKLWKEAKNRYAAGAFAVCTLYLCYWLTYWVLRGFYDVTAVALVLASLWSLEKKRPLESFAFLCFAIFLHWRGLYYAPLFYFQWKELKRIPYQRRMFWVPVCFLSISLLCFAIALPQLSRFWVNNPLQSSETKSHALTLLVILAAVHLTQLERKRDWLSASLAICYLLFLIASPQICAWHFVMVMPMVLITLKRAAGAASVYNVAATATTLVLFGWICQGIYEVPLSALWTLL
ncbi:MAG TPA: hypothetical protein VIH99_09735 [Bdellovibrionota bacterium]